jgi:hypothetical protein
MPYPNLATSARHSKVKHPLESIDFSADFTLLLAAAETLSGTPTITGAGDLTITAKAVNGSTFINDPDEGGGTVQIGCGVTFHVAGGTDGTTYMLTVSCGTNQGRTRAMVCQLIVSAK